jgi:hypothetical protein
MGMEHDHLAQADRHLTEAMARITRQQSLIRRLKDGRHDTALAEELLAALLTSHERFIEHRRLIVAAIEIAERAAAAKISARD